jgi:hypothetical protein
VTEAFAAMSLACTAARVACLAYLHVAPTFALRTPQSRPKLGVIERTFYLCMLAWFGLVAVRLL